MENIKGTIATVLDTQLTDIVLNDIKEMDGDAFMALIEFLYPISAMYDREGDILLTANDGLLLEDVFGE